MLLRELINFLEDMDQEKIVPLGFDSPHAYRNNYSELAFEPSRGLPVKKMLANAKKAVDTTYSGYKGGSFKMDLNTKVYLAKWGKPGEELGHVLLNYMMDKYK